MSNPPSQTPKDPQSHEQEPGERLNQALQQTGQRLSEELNVAGDRVRQFVEEKRVNEQLEVAGGEVVERVKGLIEEGNVRRLILRTQEGRTILEIPLTAGVAIGGIALWMNPLLAGLGAIAALVARVNIEIVRDEPEATMHDVKDTAKQIGQEVKKTLGGPSGTGSSGGTGSTGTGPR